MGITALIQTPLVGAARKDVNRILTSASIITLSSRYGSIPPASASHISRHAWIPGSGEHTRPECWFRRLAETGFFPAGDL